MHGADTPEALLTSGARGLFSRLTRHATWAVYGVTVPAHRNLITAVLLICLAAPSLAGPGADKLRLISPPRVTPQPFDPAKQATASLLVEAAVRATDGLGSQDSSASSATRFYLRTLWTTSLVVLEKKTEILPPFHFVDLPVGDGSGTKRFVRVESAIVWNARDRHGGCVADGVHDARVDVEFIRERTTPSGALVKEVDRADPVPTSIRIQGSQPEVSILSPASGTLTRAASIVVSGTTASLLPVTAKVAGQPVAVTNGTFAHEVSLPEGASRITVEIVDCRGRVTTRSVDVVRDSTPPTIRVEVPSAGAYLKTKSPTIRISYSDDAGSGIAVSTVQVTLAGADRTASFDITETAATTRAGVDLALPEGSVVLAGQVEDRAGNRAQVSSTFIVDTIPADLTVTSPAPGFVTGASPLRVTGEVRDASPISKFHINGVVVPVTNGSFSTEIAVQEGPVTLMFCLADAAGNATLRVIKGTYDAHPPQLSVIAPAEGAFYKTEPIDVSGGVFDLSSVVVYVNGIQATVQNSSFAAKVPLVHGSNLLQFVATDASGLTTSVERRVVLDLEKPSINIVSPANGSTQTTGTPEILVTYHNGLSGVDPATFHASVDAEDRTSEFAISAGEARLTLSPDRALSAGQHQIACRVSDRAGHESSASSTFQVVVGPAPPPETPTSGFACGKVSEGFSGAPLSGVEVTVAGITGTIVSRPDGTYDFPAVETGEYLLTLSKEGYTSAQRRIKIVKGRESAIKPALLIPRTPPVAVQAAVGATVTDSTGRVSVEIPPGALPADANVQVTDLPGSKFLPNDLPPESVYLSAFNFEPSTKFLVPVKVRYRLRTTVAMPSGTQIPIGRYDMHKGKWVHESMATVTADGFHVEGQINESSTCDLNPSVVFPGTRTDPTALSKQDQNRDNDGRNPPGWPLTECEHVRLNPKSGKVEASLPTRSPPDLVYDSSTVDPVPVINTEIFRDTRLASPTLQSTKLDLTVGGQYQETHYQPVGGESAFRLAWEGRNRNGFPVPTGSYPFEAKVSHNYTGLQYGISRSFGDGAFRAIPGPVTLEPVPRSNVFPGRLRIVNRTTSPFGAGWGIRELSKLHFDPDGPIMIEHGDGSSSTFRPTQILYSTFVGGTNGDYGFVAVDTSTNQELNRVSFPTSLFNPALPISMTRSFDETKAYVSRGATISALSPPGNNLQDLAVHPYVVFRSPKLSLAATPDGRKLFVGATDLRIDGHGPEFSLLDLSTNQFQVIRPRDDTIKFRLITATAVSPDGRFGYALLTGQAQTSIQSLVLKIDLTNGQTTIASLPIPHQGDAMKMALSPDGQILAINGAELLILQASNLAITGTVAGTFRDVAFNRNNSKILCGSLTGLFVYDLLESAGITVPTDSDIVGLAVSPDDRRVFFAGPTMFQHSDSPDPAGEHYSVLLNVDLETNSLRVPVPTLRLDHFSVEAPATVVEDRSRYTPGAGDFTTLVKNPDGTYVRQYTHGGEVHFDVRGRQFARIEENGRRRSYMYDGQDRLAAIIHPDGEGTTSFTYGSDGLQSIRDVTGRTTSFEMPGGRLSAVIYPDGGRRGFAYDPAGRMIQAINKLGGESTFTYGALGRAIAMQEYDAEQTAAPQSIGSLLNFLPAGQGSVSTPILAPKPADVKGSYRTVLGALHTVKLNGFGQPKEQVNPVGGMIKQTYDVRSLRTAHSDELGRTRSYGYSHNGVPTSVKHPDGAVLSGTVRNVAGATLVDSVKQPRGGITSYNYTPARQVASVVSPLQKTTSYTYGSTSLVSRIEKPTARAIQIERTPFGAPRQIQTSRAGTGAPPATWSYGYDSFRNLTSMTDPAGHTTSLSHDAVGRPTSVTNALGHTQTSSYDHDGNPTQRVDERGNRTTMNWDDEGQLIATTNALSQTTQFTYTVAHQIETLTNFRGEVTRLAYDTMGRLISRTDPLLRSTVSAWDTASQLTETLEPGNRRTAYTYDTRGRIQTVRQPDQTLIQYTYDADGPVASITDPSLRTQRVDRDLAGHVTAAIDPTGARDTFTYDDDGRLESRTDRMGQKTAYTYDTDGRIETIKFHDGEIYRTTYDNRGLLTKVTSALSGVWEFTYDAAKRLISKKDPLGNVCSYGYDPASNLTRIDEPGESGSRSVRTYTYDALNRVATITTANRSLTYTYLDAQNITRVDIAPEGTTIERARDAAGRLIRESITGPGGTRSVEYVWGSADTVDQIKQNGELILSYTYDAMRRPTRIRDERNLRDHRMTYTPSGELATVEYPSGLKKLQAWGSRGELQSLRYQTAGGGAVLTRLFSYDAKLRLTGIADEAGTLATYRYDTRDRLVRADYSDGAFEAWTHDANSNILHYDTGSLVEGRRYDLADQLIDITSTTSSGGTTSTTTAVFAHDPRGNLLRRTSGADTQELTWDPEGRLRRVTVNGQQRLSASYLDDYRLNQMEAPSGDTSSFSWFSGNVLSEFTNGVESVFRLGLLGLDETLERGPPRGSRQAVLADHLNSVIGYFDDSGSSSEFTTYAAFGKVRLGPNPGSPGYAGAQTLGDTGLVWLRNRVYSPELGRFLSRDPIEFAGGPNLYTYVGGDPINRRDPIGLQALRPAPLPPIAPPDLYRPRVDGSHLLRINQESGGATVGWTWPITFVGHSPDTSYLRAPPRYPGPRAGWDGFSTYNPADVESRHQARETINDLTGRLPARGGTYLLVDPETDQVVRTGRTNDLERRRGEHLRNPDTAPYRFEVDVMTDDYAEQRGREQLIHDEYRPPLNRINPIGADNPNRDRYMEAGRRISPRKSSCEE